MDSNDLKSRARKHLYNKSKYNKGPKNKSKNVNETKAAKPKTNLGSNWERYDEDESQLHFDKGEDFSTLAEAPISLGGHFQFKSDSRLISEIENVATAEKGFRSLDLTLLAKSLSCIPYHERCDVPKEYFSNNEEAVICQSAADSLEAYKKYLLRSKVENESGVVGDQIKGQMPNSGKVIGDTVVNNQGDVGQTQKTPVEKKEELQEELEQWLDNILDE